MGNRTIHARLSAAVERTGVIDQAGVLAFDDDVMLLCDAVRLADECGLSMAELFA